MRLRDFFVRLKNFLFCRGNQELGEYRTVYAFQRSATSEPDIHIAETHKHYADNVVVTSKYKLWNFVPKNLFEQFRRVANFYFLCVVIVQFGIQDKTPVSPTTSLLPLVFVITVTAIKQGYEDWKRHQADKEVNNRPTGVIKHGQLEEVYSKDISVGDVVKVLNDEEFPCDLVLLSSSNEEGQCHITTANLDGETNLKVRKGIPETTNLMDPETLCSLNARVECDHPEYDMYKYNGRMVVQRDGEDKTFALGPTNLLLRGARLKNTAHVYGLAVYTGTETKMALNQQDKASKFSSVERSMNTFLMVFLGVLLTETAICTGLKYAWQSKDFGKPWYLPAHPEVNALEGFIDFLAFLILFNYVIPISLYVTVELQKFCGALFFNWDIEMYHESTDEPAKANTSDLNEELGQIEYVFSDKTGTLTENDMQFRQCSIGGVKYLEQEECKLIDCDQKQPIRDKSNLTEDLKTFFTTLALCHTVEADEFEEGEETYGQKYKYQASSPDEKALCEAAARFGVVYRGRTKEYMELEIGGIIERYKVLHVLEFDSTRKRMSNILETPTGEILMLCKGAESHVINRVQAGPSQETLDHIDQYAELGLRTLTIASRKISKEEFTHVDEKLIAAQQAIGDREEQLAKVFDEVENDFVLLGATAVEDRLQDGVKNTIESLREAGIKVWVLTGDKQETAVNISHSCGLFQHNMEIMYVVQKKSAQDVEEAIEEYEKRVSDASTSDAEFAIVVDGSTIALIIDYFAERFVLLGQKCVSVLCCRMSPLQKAQIVKLVKHSKVKPITLAIGDGANDCSMIQEAHVGCGIMGKEGRQAVRTSDYAFHRFRYLKRVLLVHGHYYYLRLSTVVQYFFYKNVAFITPQFFFQFFCGFSAMPIYAGVFLTCYNIFFTSLPILLYGIFEKDLKPSTLMQYPFLYRELSKNSKMSWRQFFYWVLAGLWHSVVFFFGSKMLFDSVSFDRDLKGYGIFSFGTFVFTVVVLTTNFKLAMVTHYWTWMTHFVMWGSNIFYIVFLLILCAFLWPWPGLRSAFDMDLDLDLYYIVYFLMKTASFWFGTIVLILAALLPDALGLVLSRAFIPSKIQIAQDEEKELPVGRNQINSTSSQLNLTRADELSLQTGRMGTFDTVELINFKAAKNKDSNA